MKILNLGSLNLDRIYHVEHFAAPGETIQAQDFETSCGGKGLNQSLALARAGGEVFHAGAVGGDGGPLLSLLDEAGVDTRFLRRLNTPSGHAIIQVAPSGENCIIVYGGANAQVSAAMVDEALGVFGPGDLLLLQNETANVGYAIRSAKARGMQVALNPSPITAELLSAPLELVDLFILNEVEGRALGGAGSYPEMLAALRARFPAAAFILTVGEDGAYYQRGDHMIRHGIFPVPVVDTTAAGDTFCGYFLACLSKGLSPEKALALASRASSLAVSRLGAAGSIPHWDEVIESSLSCVV